MTIRCLPKALREQLWLKRCGKVFETQCRIHWCKNKINVFDFTVGHNIPKSKGGTNSFQNLDIICSRCNSSMGNRYTIEEWNKM